GSVREEPRPLDSYLYLEVRRQIRRPRVRKIHLPPPPWAARGPAHRVRRLLVRLLGGPLLPATHAAGRFPATVQQAVRPRAHPLDALHASVPGHDPIVARLSS